MIHYGTTIDIAKPPRDVFAVLDDFAKTPQWSEGCISIVQTSSGPRAVGSQLHYTHKSGGRAGEMTGEMKAYAPDRDFVMHFTDKWFGVEIGFHLAASADGAGTHLTHTCAIEIKALMFKLMTPMIRRENEKQVARNLGRLKALVETSA